MTEPPHDVNMSPHQQERQEKAKMALTITYVNIALYAMCFQLQRPVEPFLIQELAKDAATDANIRETYGNLQSFFSAIQTVGSPLVGILLDRIGIRHASAMVFFASAVSYAILALATDMNWLFYSKVPSALQHAFLVAQATAATSTSGEAGRARALAGMTTAYTVGATAGPALGGFLAQQGDLYFGARLAVLGSLVSVVLSLLFLPSKQGSDARHSTEPKNDNNMAPASPPTVKRSLSQELQHSLQIGLRSSLWPLLVVKVVGGVTSSMHSTALPLVLTQELHFDPAALGLNMSVSMFSVALFGALVVQPLTKQLGANGMARSGLVVRSILGLVLAAMVSLPYSTNNMQQMHILIHATCAVHGLASHVLATGLTTQTTGAVQGNEQGSLLGLEHGLFSLARVYGPSAGTHLLAWAGLWHLEQFCGGVDLALVLVLAMAAAVASRDRSKKTKSA